MRRVLIGMLLTGVSTGACAASFAVSKTADTNDGVCNSECSLREAVRAANASAGSDTVVLPSGAYVLTLAGNDDFAATGDLDITGDLDVTGAGSAVTTVSTSVAGRVFHLDPPGSGNLTVALRNITVSGGVDNFGGGILNNANLTLQGVRVSANQATNGGGVWSGRNVFMQDAVVNNNQAITTGTTADGFGGGVLISGATLTLVNTSVTVNSASRNGGGVYAPSAIVMASGGSAFSGNIAGNQGGGIEGAGTPTAPSTITMTAAFSSNQANDGGAISNLRYSTTTCTSCQFTANQANGNDLGGGGAIFNYEGTVNVASGTFTDNIANSLEGGGAIENAGDAVGGIMTITNSTFTGNRAPNPATNAGIGGALFVLDGSMTTVSGTTFVNNFAGSSGGAIYVDQNATISLTDVMISGSTAQRLFGGAVLNEGALTLLRTTVSSNVAGTFAGGISSRAGPLTVLDSEITSNTAPDAGGIGNFGSSLTIRRSTIASNQATKASGAFGGGLLFDFGVGTIENSTFSGNSGPIGGGISNNGSGTANLTLVNVTITGNVATQAGSAIALFNSGTVSVRNSAISGNCHVAASVPVTSLGGNIESPGNTCSFTQGSDARNVASLLVGGLANNGGLTRTHDPLVGSLLIDFVPVGQCIAAAGGTLATDQRGFDRPFDGNNDAIARCDSGAVEKQPQNAIFSNGFE